MHIYLYLITLVIFNYIVKKIVKRIKLKREKKRKHNSQLHVFDNLA